MSDKQNVTRARVYRFGGSVAVSFHGQGGDTQTLYMPADLAVLVAGLLNDCADDIETCRFTESHLGTWLAGWVIDRAELRKE